jgi:hypothetical protein
MKNKGAVRRLQVERAINFRRISVQDFVNFNVITVYINAQRYTISEYRRLIDWGSGSVEEKVLPIKRSLYERKPVVIGMPIYPTFRTAKEVWQPSRHENSTGGHAMCVVGYDNNKYGGAFEIQNSWGTEWGNNGYIWVKYEDFAEFVYEAYEIIENLANYKDSARYAANIEIEVYNSKSGMPVTFDRQGFYRTRQSYPSGTEFRFMMNNRYSAYVYAFAADSYTPGTTRIFPLQGVSPVLDYPETVIAWPGEFDWIKMDDVTGTDYLVVLYSKQALDIDTIERRFAEERGTFPERVARAVGANFISFANVQYNPNIMEFATVSINPRAVFGLLLAIDHR